LPAAADHRETAAGQKLTDDPGGGELRVICFARAEHTNGRAERERGFALRPRGSSQRIDVLQPAGLSRVVTAACQVRVAGSKRRDAASNKAPRKRSSL